MTAKEIVAELERAGWKKDRQKGSHAVFKHPQRSDRIVVPIHPGDVPVGTTRAILKKAGLQQ